MSGETTAAVEPHCPAGVVLDAFDTGNGLGLASVDSCHAVPCAKQRVEPSEDANPVRACPVRANIYPSTILHVNDLIKRLASLHSPSFRATFTMFSPSVLWSAPVINPINRKARSIPVFNPINQYGRVFFFSWWGFFIAFWSWYAFPPLLVRTIRQDLSLSQTDVANSNIAALTGTLVVRFLAGPLCDRFGPRWTYVVILLAGSIPTALAGAVTNVSGLIALRFFVGILGGTFVPCQVWSTGFFDKNVVGTSNALIGGWGNSGGGITYFLMPIIYDSLRADQGLSSHVAWRVAFIVPFILIVATALGMIFFCPDTPTGKWSERHLVTRALLDAHLPPLQSAAGVMEKVDSSNASPEPEKYHAEKGESSENADVPAVVDIGTGSIRIATDHEAQMSKEEMTNVAKGEIVVAPSFKEAMHVIFSMQTLFHCATYICSFGG
jgi:NNP family nitrate/nitrite transporter-like MFS transporter